MESILIADDEIGQCTVLTEELREVGFNAEYVCNGQEVFEYLSANQVVMLLLDLNMPVKNWLNETAIAVAKEFFDILTELRSSI